jgi:hypothetical protein
MSKTTRATDGHTATSASDGTFVERLMAISQVERGFIASNPKLRREIRFQALALMLGPTSLAYAVYTVAISLLGHTPVSAAPLAAVAAISLFAIDQHYLIQARGNASDDVRRSMYKVRAISILIISLSFALMVTDTFRTDIERVLAESRQAQRAQLEQSPRYQTEFDAARAAVAQARQAAEHAEALRARIAQMQTERAFSLQEMTNEIQGNTTANKIRKGGYGPKARGYEAEAKRLELEIKAANEDLGRLGDVSERMAAAKQQLATIDQQIDGETQLAFGGNTQRLEAMIPLLQKSLSAWVAVTFWLLIGALPDLLMLAAQRKMFNHELFASMRAVEHEDLQAQIAQIRRELRQRHTDRLMPLEVRLAAAPRPAATSQADTSGHASTGKDVAGERA